jgi:hypothetical protein
MGLLLFMLVIAVAFTWLVARSIRAGYGRGLFYLAWFCVGISVVLSIQTPAPAIERFLVQVWAYSLIGLPAWWAISALRRGRGSTR